MAGTSTPLYGCQRGRPCALKPAVGWGFPFVLKSQLVSLQCKTSFRDTIAQCSSHVHSLIPIPCSPLPAPTLDVQYLPGKVQSSLPSTLRWGGPEWPEWPGHSCIHVLNGLA